MSARVDELFGASGAGIRPRTTLIFMLLFTGLMFTLLGLACTSAPGGLLVLAAWGVADDDLARVRSGALPADTGAAASKLRGWTTAGLVVVVVLFLAQLVLLSLGFYDELWGQAIQVAFPAPEPPP